MTIVKVTFESLSGTSSQLSTGAANIDSELQGLKRNVDDLVSDGWQGAASVNFEQMYTTWQTSAAQLKDALDGIAGLLASAAQTYQTTETDIASKMR